MLTLREMAGKHGCTNGRIAQLAKKNGWVRGDLQKAVKQATAAMLIEQHLSSEVSKAKQGLSDTVIAAAELNKTIVLGHRSRLAKLLKDADSASAKLMALAEDVDDVREAAVLVGAIESLSRTTKSIIDKEREAYGLDKGGDKGTDLENLSDEDLDARISEHLSRRK